MIVSDQRPPSEDWLVRRIVDLERQVRELQAGRRLEAATIGAGGLTVNGGSIRVLDGAGGSVELAGGALRVLDPAGNVIVELGKMVDGRYGWRVNNAAGEPQVRAGELAGGGYGLEAVDAGGDLVSLLTLAFGLRSADANANEIVNDTAGAWVSLTGDPAVPDVPIGSSGRALVTVSADVLCAPIGSVGRTEGWMGFEISGATSVAPDIYDTLRVRYTRDADTAGNTAVDVAASRQNLVTGLNAGLHTFTSKYRVIAPGNQVEFQGRNITVVPF